MSQVVLGQREQLSVFGDDYDTPDGTCVRDYMWGSSTRLTHLQTLLTLL
jgi:UDP-glucose 4-epimerase